MADTAVGQRTASELPGYRPVLTGPQLEVLHHYGAEQRVAIGEGSMAVRRQMAQTCQRGAPRTVYRLPTLSLTALPMRTRTAAPTQTGRRPHICIGSVARALIFQRPLEIVHDVLDLRERRRPVEIPRLVS